MERGVFLKRSVLELHKSHDNDYQAVIKNNHGRLIYMKLAIVDDCCEIKSCFYIDREKRPVPKLFVTNQCELDNLLSVIANELDKCFDSYQFVDLSALKTEDFIKQFVDKEKYNILIMLQTDDVLKTIFKNRYHRAIYLEIDTSREKALIRKCKYCDKRGKDVDVTPYNLTTIFFEFSNDSLLSIVNKELEGGFTDVVITDNHTIALDRPICGSI